MSDSIASLAAVVYLYKTSKSQYYFKDTELRRELVFPGNYFVSDKKELALEACLGSCVGVTICDKEANVGGLIPSQFSTIVDLIPHKILEGSINLHDML